MPKATPLGNVRPETQPLSLGLFCLAQLPPSSLIHSTNTCWVLRLYARRAQGRSCEPNTAPRAWLLKLLMSQLFSAQLWARLGVGGTTSFQLSVSQSGSQEGSLSSCCVIREEARRRGLGGLDLQPAEATLTIKVLSTFIPPSAHEIFRRQRRWVSDLCIAGWRPRA